VKQKNPSPDWSRVAISEVCEGLFDGPHATPAPANEGPVFLGIGNIRDDGHLDLSDIRHISEADYPKWTKRVEPRAGDIVFTYEATLNRYALIPEGFRGCLGRRLALIRPDKKKVDTRFLFYSFFGADWRNTIERNRLAGSTVDRIPIAKFPGFPISLPPLPTQRRIAGILSAYDDLIEVNRRRIAVLEEMARRLFDEWFGRLRFPGHIDATDRASDSLPHGWTKGVLQDVVVLQRGFDLPTKERTPGPYPVIAATGVHGTHIAAKVGGPGVVTGRSGSLGEVLHIEGDFWPLNTTLWGKEFPLASTYYAYFVLSNLDLKGQNGGAAVPTLNRNDVHQMPVLLPPRKIVQTFDLHVEPLFKLKKKLLKANDTLRMSRDLLLPKLISGEIDLEQSGREADRTIRRVAAA
jgi:type I restriction enzyme S subunit